MDNTYILQWMVGVGVFIATTIITHLGTTIWWMSKTNTKLDFLLMKVNDQSNNITAVWRRVDEHGEAIAALKERTS